MSEREPNFDWAVPVMRAGYAGRGLVYFIVAGFSLFAIWHGGSAQGTGSALKSLETAPFGQLVLGLVVLGMAAYAIWRVVDALWDLEDYGRDGKGLMARAGMVVTGLVHGAIGLGALAVLLYANDGGDSTIATWTGKIMAMPMGRLIVGLAGLATIGAGIYYLWKAFSEKYREHLRASSFTRKWNWVLKAGVAAQGVLISVIGGYLGYAALTHDPDKAGGTTKVFEFLGTQPFGQALVGLFCLGLLCFAVFCFVNAVYRIIPKLDDGSIESLADLATS